MQMLREVFINNLNAEDTYTVMNAIIIIYYEYSKIK